MSPAFQRPRPQTVDTTPTLPPTLPTQSCWLFLQNMPRNCPWRHGHQHHADLSCRHHSPEQEQPRNRGPLRLPQPPQRLFSTQQVTQHLSQTHHASAHNPRWLLGLHRCSHGQRNVLRKNLLRTISKNRCSELRVQETASKVSHRTRQTTLEAFLGCLSTDVTQGVNGPEELASKNNVCGLQGRIFSKNWTKH